MAYANFERLAPVNTIRAGGPVYPLPEAPRDVWSLLTTAATRRPPLDAPWIASLSGDP